MKQTKEIKNFFYGQYFADGLRITIGCIVPVLIAAGLGQFQIGTVMSFGALVVGLSDTPGAPSHRRIGMISCILLCILTDIITVLVNHSTILMAIVIAILCFTYSMFAVYNSRATTVGIMAILMMLINVDDILTAQEEFHYLFFFILGAVWYMTVSLLLTQARPYRLAQQELSESVRQVADFIHLKANFYNINIDIEDNYAKLIEKQILVNSHQENVRELLFQSKRSIKDTTKIGRYLSLVFSDIVDLYEQSMSTHYDYSSIHQTFGPTHILFDFKHILLKITNELDHLAFRLNANRIPDPLYDFTGDIENLKLKVDKIEDEDGVNTIPLKKIIINIRGMITLVNNIYSYNHINNKDIKREELQESSRFVGSNQFDWHRFRENISLNSSIFRHAIRMAVVMSFSYFGMKTFGFENYDTYWVLLTILVILKPGFGLTKERNLQRLMGTAIGGVVGAIILITVPDETIRFILLAFFFLTAYSFFRVNYIVTVMFITPYVLILLSFSGMNTIEVAKERIFDTFLGGGIAFLSSYVILPNWESFQIRSNMRKLLIANYRYISLALQTLLGERLSITEVKLSRKDVYISSANMSSTFQRMITEPKWKQKNTKEVNRFVILNHILSSYSATLLTQVGQTDTSKFMQEHVKSLKSTLRNLEKSISSIPTEDGEDFNPTVIDNENLLTSDYKKKEETKLMSEQLQFLNKISSDLVKVTKEVMKKERAEKEND